MFNVCVCLHSIYIIFKIDLDIDIVIQNLGFGHYYHPKEFLKKNKTKFHRVSNTFFTSYRILQQKRFCIQGK